VAIRPQIAYVSVVARLDFSGLRAMDVRSGMPGGIRMSEPSPTPIKVRAKLEFLSIKVWKTEKEEDERVIRASCLKDRRIGIVSVEIVGTE